MKQNETMPVDVQDKLVKTFEARMQNLGISTYVSVHPGTQKKRTPKPNKKYIEAQQEFLAGAVAAIDTVFENTNSCIPPGWFFAILRGEIVETSKKETI